MATSNVPTSPKAKAERSLVKAMETKPSLFRRLLYLLAVVTISGMVGFSSALIARNYQPNWPLAEFIIVDSTGTSYEEPEVVFVNSGNGGSVVDVISVLQQQQRNTIVSIFPSSATEYSTETELGKGVIVSADGWIVTLNDVLTLSETEEYTIMLPNGDVYSSNRVINDAFAGVSFIDIQANRLSVVDFKTDETVLGEQVVLYTDSVLTGDSVAVAYVEGTRASDNTTFTTAQYNTHVRITESVSNAYLGSPVFDMSGNFVGLNALENRVVPVAAISSGVYELFSTKNIERHSQVIRYVPIYREVQKTTTRDFGIRIVEAPENSSLLADDIIVSANGTELNADQTFSLLMASLSVGTVVEFELLREGVLQTVQYTVE